MFRRRAMPAVLLAALVPACRRAWGTRPDGVGGDPVGCRIG